MGGKEKVEGTHMGSDGYGSGAPVGREYQSR